MSLWWFDLVVYLYAFSLFFFFLDFVHQSKRSRRWGAVFLSAVWGLVSLFFVREWIGNEAAFFFSLPGSLLFYVWFLVGISFVIHYGFRIELLTFFSNLLGMLILAFGFLAFGKSSEFNFSQNLVSELLVVHITLAILSYVAFSFSLIFSVMYLLQNRLLKGKMWNRWFVRLPSLEQTERFAFHFNILGVPLFLFAIVLGLIWAELMLTTNYWLDPKMLTSFVVLLSYGYAIYQRMQKGVHGKPLAYLNLLSFCFVVINLSVSLYWTSFHRW